MKHCIAAAALFCMLVLGFGPGAFAEGGPWDDENFSATMTLTTDYVSRGVSFSDEDPAIQGTFDYAHPGGFFAGIWGSSWDDAGYSNDIELGYYAGYGGSLGKMTYSVWATYYQYPGAEDDGFEFDYWEFSGGLYHTIEDVPLKPALGFEYYFSPEYSGEDGLFHYVSGSVDWSLPLGLTLNTLIGYKTVEGDKSTGGGAGMDGDDGYDYIHWKVGVSKEIKGFTVDISYHDTGEHDYLGDAGDARVVFSLSRSL
ncbi:TorF family putative porin [Desulfatiferula olefinivorans]